MTGAAASEAFRRRSGIRPRSISFSRPFPLQPLLDVVQYRVHVDAAKGFNRIGELYRHAGITRDQASRWGRTGLSVYNADRCAIRLELHPALIWGTLWWDVCEREDYQQEMVV